MNNSYLNEYTRKRLLDKSKKDTPERYKRRTDSSDDWSIYRIGILELSVSDDLYIYFKVHSYRVGLRIIDFKPVLLQYLNGKYKSDKTKAIKKAVDHAIRYNHIQTACDCSDFKYRYAYMATLKGYGLDTDETRPATKTNPNNKGGLCKHQIKILNFPSRWIPQVVSALKSYVRTSPKEGD